MSDIIQGRYITSYQYLDTGNPTEHVTELSCGKNGFFSEKQVDAEITKWWLDVVRTSPKLC
ncbi:hypothetical protein KP79_PYT21893 [Mizuhopecten yessoensis]|uniref:Uncharacterized protein n=1 Tax=Mizuhopecten yessoensis TaxID=6573 RepID=A0A210R4B0_MIZYE|nr:hypothetical protein KP79_PYT21893 [Mizuhopecten yessoensis]